MKQTTKTTAAISKYTRAGCIRAYMLNQYGGEGARTIAQQYDVYGVYTTRSADAAINAGREIVAAGGIDLNAARVAAGLAPVA
jgi:hypothetical protein